MPEMTYVDSSNIEQIGYDSDKTELHVIFKDGSLYVYNNVPLQIYEELLGAPSKGSYLNREEYALLQSDTSGDFGGVGVTRWAVVTGTTQPAPGSEDAKLRALLEDDAWALGAAAVLAFLPARLRLAHTETIYVAAPNHLGDPGLVGAERRVIDGVPVLTSPAPN